MAKHRKILGELMPPGLYAVLNLFIQKYGPILPFTFSLAQRKLVLKKNPTSRRFLIYLSSLLELLHPALSSFLLGQKMLQGKANYNRNSMEIVRTFILLYVTLTAPIFMAMNYTIVQTPWVFVNMFNGMESPSALQFEVWHQL